MKFISKYGNWQHINDENIDKIIISSFHEILIYLKNGEIITSHTISTKKL